MGKMCDPSPAKRDIIPCRLKQFHVEAREDRSDSDVQLRHCETSTQVELNQRYISKSGAGAAWKNMVYIRT